MGTKTHKQFIEDVYNIVGDEYAVIGKYIRSNVKIKFNHSVCGKEINLMPSVFLSGRRCPYCNGTKKDTDIYKKEVYTLVNDEYEVIGEYINDATKISMKHNKCNLLYEIAPNYFLSGTRCSFCSIRKTNEQFLKEVYNLVKNDYVILEKYRGSTTKIEFKHNVEYCKNIFFMKPNNFLSGARCPKCSSLKKTTEIFSKEVLTLTKGEFLVIGNYINAITKISLKHNVTHCGHEFEISPNGFLRNKSCPNCKESKGEKKVKEYLDDNNITYKIQYKMLKCKNKRPLPFDFAIYDNENRLKLIIEYDGLQHFKPVQFGNMSIDKSLKSFNQTMINDNIKNEYCKLNNIRLVRIPYWEFKNIDNILAQEILDETVTMK